MTPEVKAALEHPRQEQAAIGAAWVLPAPKNADKACTRYVMRSWFLQAAAAANIVLPPKAGYHSFRRDFSVRWRHLPMKTLMTLGGWKTSQTVLLYQGVDVEEVRRDIQSGPNSGPSQKAGKRRRRKF